MYLNNTKNFVAIIASSCLSSILVNYIIIQGNINPTNLINNIINLILFIIVYFILATLISLPLLFIPDSITIIFERVRYQNMKTVIRKMRSMLSIKNIIYATAIILLQYSVFYTIKTMCM